MMEEEVVPVPKKRGRPKGSRPKCEKEVLAGYPNPDKWVIWGVEPECKRFKRKGLALLYNPEHKGGQVTLLPVTDDGGEGLRWRYRYVPGPMPYSYNKIDLEPGQTAATTKEIVEFIMAHPNLPDELKSILLELAGKMAGIVKEHFGDIKGADKTTEVFHSKVKDSALSEKMKKIGNIC
jgi:hypothetical protein